MDETKGKSDPRAHVAPTLREQIVGAHVHDTQRNSRLDDARRRTENIQRGQGKCHAMGDREGGYDHGQSPDRAAEQKQPDKKQ